MVVFSLSARDCFSGSTYSRQAAASLRRNGAVKAALPLSNDELLIH